MVEEHQLVVLEELLRPLPGSDPSGRTLQYDVVYDQIKEARRADDLAAPRDIWSKELKSADWDEVRRLCEATLLRVSKDLQICAWLTEAWLHLEGLRGLRRGIELLLQMSESYWETVHPSLDAGVEFRAAPFVWVNEKLPASLGQVVIVAPKEDPAAAATWDEWKRALWLDKVGARRPQDPEIVAELESSPTIADFKKRCTRTPESFFRDNVAVIEDAIEVTRSLEALLDDRLEEQSPSLVRFREGLKEILTWTQVMVRDGSFTPDAEASAVMAEETTDKPAGAAAPTTAPGATKSVGPIGSRADAYRQLLTAAQYLKEVEPHSPTPYLVLKAVSWGDLTLDDLLREFVREGLNLEALFTFLGIEPGDER